MMFISLLAVVTLMTIGYAAFSTSVKITGKSKIVCKSETPSEKLMQKLTKTGSCLYIDPNDTSRYVFKGGTPENYIKLGNDLYRIISLENDGTIKVMKKDYVSGQAWDKASSRTSEYCGTSAKGCKVWGSKTTTFDANGNSVTKMPIKIGEALKEIPDKEATLNTYLNNEWYNSLDSNVKKYIEEKYWDVGPVGYDMSSIAQNMQEASAYRWKGKIALISVVDYVKASNNSACVSAGAYRSTSACYNNSQSHNYLTSTKQSWLLSPFSHSAADAIWYMFSTTSIRQNNASSLISFYPSFYLSSDIKLCGEGTEANPYSISE